MAKKRKAPKQRALSPIRFNLYSAEARKIRQSKPPEFTPSSFTTEKEKINRLITGFRTPAPIKRRSFKSEKEKIQRLSKPNIPKAIPFGKYTSAIYSSSPALRKEIYRGRESQIRREVKARAREFLGGKEDREAKVLQLKQALVEKKKAELEMIRKSEVDRTRVIGEHKKKIMGLISELEEKKEKEKTGVEEAKLKYTEEIKKAKRDLTSKRIHEVRRFGEATVERVGVLASRWGAKRAVSRRVLRKVPRATVVMREREIPSVLGDPNRFFKSKYEEDKRQFFFT